MVFELPSGSTAADVVTTLGAVVTLLAAGHPTPEEASAVASVIEGQRRAIETAEQARLKAIEEKIGVPHEVESAGWPPSNRQRLMPPRAGPHVIIVRGGLHYRDPTFATAGSLRWEQGPAPGSVSWHPRSTEIEFSDGVKIGNAKFWAAVPAPRLDGGQHQSDRLLSHISCCKRERHHGPGIRPCEPPANRTRPAQIAELKATGCAKMFPEKASGARGDRAELARVIKRLQPGTCRFSHVATPLPNFPLLLTHGRNLKATSAGTSGSSNGFGRRAIMGLVRLIAPFVVICFATGALFAQTPALDSAVQRKVDLTVAQKQILYQSIGNIQKNDAAPTGFTATVGADIPSGIALVPVPETIAEIIPQTKGLETAMVEGQVLLVEPQGKTIVAVIALEL